jgi:hypothetical protein
VFQLGSKLLAALEKNKLPRNDETVKGVGWFLVCIGESLDKGSLQQARQLHSGGHSTEGQSLAVAFCTAGDQIMDWGTGILLQERKARREAKRKERSHNESA